MRLARVVSHFSVAMGNGALRGLQRARVRAPYRQTRPFVNLLKGHPTPAHLPRAALSKALAECTKNALEDSFQLNYTPCEGPEGFLSALTSFLKRQCRGDGSNAGSEPADNSARPDGLFVTGGVSHGLELACGVFGTPGAVALVEAPSYFLAFDIFKARGMRVVPVASDERGLDPAELRRTLESLPRGSVSFLYTIPVHGNPTGVTLATDRRRAIVDMAQEFGFIVLADEVYHMLDWSGPASVRPQRMVLLDPAYRAEPRTKTGGDYEVPVAAPADMASVGSTSRACVLSVAAFTKILSPGFRLGWIEGAPSLVKRLAEYPYVQSGGGLSPLQAQIAQVLLETKAQDAHLDRLRRDYRRRSAMLHAAIARYPRLLRAHTSEPPRGGYFTWVEVLPKGVDTVKLQALANERFQVNFLPGPRCYPEKGDGSSPGGPDALRRLRLCFAYVADEADLGRGVDAIAEAIEATLVVDAIG